MADPGSIPESGRSPGGGNSNPTALFLPGDSQGQRSLAGHSPRGHRADTAEWLTLSWASVQAPKLPSAPLSSAVTSRPELPLLCVLRLLCGTAGKEKWGEEEQREGWGRLLGPNPQEDGHRMSSLHLRPPRTSSSLYQGGDRPPETDLKNARHVADPDLKSRLSSDTRPQSPHLG